MQSWWTTTVQSRRLILPKPQKENCSSSKQECVGRGREQLSCEEGEGQEIRRVNMPVKGLNLFSRSNCCFPRTLRSTFKSGQMAYSSIVLLIWKILSVIASGAGPTNHTASKGHHVQFTWKHNLSPSSSSTLTPNHKASKPLFFPGVLEIQSHYIVYIGLEITILLPNLMLGLQACIS